MAAFALGRPTVASLLVVAGLRLRPELLRSVFRTIVGTNRLRQGPERRSWRDRELGRRNGLVLDGKTYRGRGVRRGLVRRFDVDVGRGRIVERRPLRGPPARTLTLSLSA